MSQKKFKFKTIHYMLIYILICIAQLFLCSLTTVDEFYRYRVISGMIDGFELYKDINIITTPLIYWIAAPILFINNNVITMRIINIVVWMVTLYFIHKIAKKFNFNEAILFLFNSSLLTFIISLKTFYYDYNHYCLMFLVILIYILLFEDFSYKYSVVIGFICSLTILTKQTTGVLITIGVAISILYLNKNKDKIFWKKVLLTIFAGAAILLLFAAYLFISGNWYYFCDLCVLGIGQFTQNILITDSAVILFFIIVICVFLSYINKFDRFKDRRNIVFIFFIIITLINSFPIFDVFHLCITFVLMFMLIFNSEIVIPKSIYCTLLLGCFICLSSFISDDYNDEKKSYCEYSGFENIKVYKGFKTICEELTNVVDKYYDKDIYIIDISASSYNHALGLPNTYYDLLFTGHTGATSSLQHIKNLVHKDCILITPKSPQQHYQLNPEIFEYIKNNYELIDETFYSYIYKP